MFAANHGRVLPPLALPSKRDVVVARSSIYNASIVAGWAHYWRQPIGSHKIVPIQALGRQRTCFHFIAGRTSPPASALSTRASIVRLHNARLAGPLADID